MESIWQQRRLGLESIVLNPPNENPILKFLMLFQSKVCQSIEEKREEQEMLAKPE